MNLIKNIHVLRELFRLNILRVIEYRINFLLEAVLRFVEFAVFYFFWESILNANGNIPGWGIVALLILYAFRQIFLACFNLFVGGIYFLEDAIIKGDIDKYLSRPIQPWFVLLGEHAFPASTGFLLGIGALILAQIFFSANVLTLQFPFILFLILIATFITAFFGLILGCLTFWFGRTRAFNFIMEAFWTFDAYPMTIFPSAIQTLTSFVMPLLFATTIPTLAVIGTISFTDLLLYIGVALFILAIEITAFLFVWKKGVEKYESSGG